MSIKAKDFILTSVRLVFFTPRLQVFKQAQVLGSIYSKFVEKYDGIVQALPFAQGMSADFPLVRLASENGMWQITASPARISSSWTRKEEKEPAQLITITEECLKPLQHYINKNNVHVGRIGFVITRVCKVDDPEQTLLDRFFKEEVRDTTNSDAPFRNSDKIEIHNLKRYESTIPELTINSWVRCRSGITELENYPVISVEQDINTLNEELESNNFDQEQITQFINMSVTEFDKILEKYFKK